MNRFTFRNVLTLLGGVSLITLLSLCAEAQQITVTRQGECEYICESPRSSRQVSCHNTKQEAVASCANQSFSNGADYDVVGGRWTVSTSNATTPGPTPDPIPDPIPDPDLPPSGEALPEFTFDIQGFGRKTRGAHDCATSTVYRVTSLSNDRNQPGTLMNATRGHCRYIVFDVAGDIDMTNALPNNTGGDSGGVNTWRIVGTFLTIDGRTAPAPGITLTNVDRVSIECRGPRPCTGAHDIIVSNIRTVSDYGPGADANQLITKGHWIIDGSEGDVHNIALDHLTMINSGQGNVNIYARVRDVTLQHSFSDGSLVGHHISGAGFLRQRISIFKHVYAHHNERQVRVRYNSQKIDIVGNVVYGWGWYEGGAAGLNPDIGGPNYYSSANIENNIYHFVGAAPFGRSNDALNNEGISGDWYFANNVWPVGEDEGDAAATSTTRVDMEGYELPREFPTRAEVLNAGAHYKTTAEIETLTQIADAVGL